MSDLSKRRQRQLKNEGYDLAFLSQIQPQGNIDFQKDDRSWISGDGHHTVLHYYAQQRTIRGTVNDATKGAFDECFSSSERNYQRCQHRYGW